MPKFRKKPVIIEAVRVTDALEAALPSLMADHEAVGRLPRWLEDAYRSGVLSFVKLENAVEIRTLEGTMRGAAHDWIIQGVGGELYPCKPDIFEATYVPISTNVDELEPTPAKDIMLADEWIPKEGN